LFNIYFIRTLER